MDNFDENRPRQESLDIRHEKKKEIDLCSIKEDLEKNN